MGSANIRIRQLWHHVQCRLWALLSSMRTGTEAPFCASHPWPGGRSCSLEVLQWFCCVCDSSAECVLRWLTTVRDHTSLQLLHSTLADPASPGTAWHQAVCKLLNNKWASACPPPNTHVHNPPFDDCTCSRWLFRACGWHILAVVFSDTATVDE